MSTSTAETAAPASVTPSFAELLSVFGKIGLLSFGGPAAQIALMHKMLVDERRWIDEKRYLSALNFCMLLPGPEAMQLATYVGWRLHGLAGGLAAGLLFVLPGAAVMMALSLVYALYGQVPAVGAVFFGIKAAVLAIVVEALLRIARRASFHIVVVKMANAGTYAAKRSMQKRRRLREKRNRIRVVITWIDALISGNGLDTERYGVFISAIRAARPISMRHPQRLPSLESS